LYHQLEDAQKQLKVMGEEGNKYPDQVKRLVPIAGNSGNGGCRVHNGSEILGISGADRRTLPGWMAQLAMKIA
jgi:hypothetical protein